MFHNYDTVTITCYLNRRLLSLRLFETIDLPLEAISNNLATFCALWCPCFLFLDPPHHKSAGVQKGNGVGGGTVVKEIVSDSDVELLGVEYVSLSITGVVSVSTTKYGSVVLFQEASLTLIVVPPDIPLSGFTLRVLNT